MSNLPTIKELLARRAQQSPAPALTLPQNVSEEGSSEREDPSPRIPSGQAVDKLSSLGMTDDESSFGRQRTLPQDDGRDNQKSEVTQQLEEKMASITRKESEQETERQARSLGIPAINLQGFPISPEALQLIPEAQARALKIIAFLFTGSEIRLAVRDPEIPQAQEILFQLTERHKANGKIYLMSEQSFASALKLYEALPKINAVMKGVEITEDDLKKYQAGMNDLSSVAKMVESANATDIMTVVLAAAMKLHSSDVHIEAEESGIVVRLRIDGMLQEIATLEREQWKKIINRIKLVASIKLNITDKAQDGRFTIFQKSTQIDVRVSTIPTAFGESIVMRLLNPETIALEFDALGFRAPVLKKVMHEITRPNGMIMTTGPTGSGKTTTLYAILKRLNTPDVKIITLEDPIEYKLEGINQSQIDTNKEYTFGKGLRSILRQDPDIVMVGEIRDTETAETAIQAALTGHLLLSTIHTNDAAGAIPRFLSMGVAPHLLAPAINAIMGQRLVRKLCEACKEKAELTPDEQTQIQAHFDALPPNAGETAPNSATTTWYRAKGCAECHNTGFKGRVGVYEVLIKDSELEQAILKSNGSLSEYDMRAIAKNQGMVTMAQDGLLKASEGLTSIAEIARVVGL